MIDENQLEKIYDTIITHNNEQSKKSQEPTLVIIKDYLEMIKNVRQN